MTSHVEAVDLTKEYDALRALDRVSIAALSSGKQQRVTIARALALERDSLLVDEATANLDPANAIIIERAIKTQLDPRLSCSVSIASHRLEGSPDT
jgi:ABC-type phosphate transport system ATPase subunit